MSKPILAIDNDDVLFGLVDSIFDYYNKLHQTNFKLEDQKVFDLEATFGLTAEDTMSIVYDFYRSNYLLACKPIPGAFKVLKKLKAVYDLVLITARPTFTKKVTLKALEEHYPEIFSAVYLTNAYSKSGKKKPKSTVCLEVGAKLLVDDALHNAQDCADKGVPVVLFQRPWNQFVKPKDLKGQAIYPAKNWQEVYQLVPDILSKH